VAAEKKKYTPTLVPYGWCQNYGCIVKKEKYAAILKLWKLKDKSERRICTNDFRCWKFKVWGEMESSGIHPQFPAGLPTHVVVFSCVLDSAFADCCVHLQIIFTYLNSCWRSWFVQGTMRVLLVLLHDFPEFLCDYHYAFCDVIPPNCIQVRNLVLSAFPRNMRLPDPFTPNLKVDMLPEITHAPRVMSNFVSFIQPQSFKKVDFFPLVFPFRRVWWKLRGMLLF